ncbi:MAG: class I SAM-dependent methyltransferase [Planctomycetota bacterium]
MTSNLCSPPEMKLLDSLAKETEILQEHIRRKAAPPEPLDILEAGCGNSWELDLAGVPYVLTGVDVDEAGLNLRKTDKRDLDHAIVGDLRTVSLAEETYDVIYNSFVLEHVEDAERVLDNFLRWLKPGGILILRIPDRGSVYGFLTRATPFWVHVLYKRWLEGSKNAGKPGFGPFPTMHETVVSREGIHGWCVRQGVTIKAEYGSNDFFNAIGRFALPVKLLMLAIHLLSLRKLAADHSNLTYVIEKPPAVSVNEETAAAVSVARTAS